jgi:hypothetical protein
MSIIISDCNEIFRDPANTSKAKQLYSFSKQSRFPNGMNNLNPNIQYNIPSTITKVGTKFGSEERKDVFRDRKSSPPPNAY